MPSTGKKRKLSSADDDNNASDHASSSSPLELPPYEPLSSCGSHAKAISSIEIAPTTRDASLALVASGSADRTVKLWDVRAATRSTGDKAAVTLEGHKDGINDISWRSEPNIIVSQY